MVVLGSALMSILFACGYSGVATLESTAVTTPPDADVPERTDPPDSRYDLDAAVVTCPNAADPGSCVKTVALGDYMSCALLLDGRLYCWGRNDSGAVGVGTQSGQPVVKPSQVSLDHIAQISLGGGHACALRDDGTVSCWGFNDYGQLGEGTNKRRTTPTPVTGLTDARAIALGDHHSCALVAGGNVRCWGQNGDGQLASGDTNDRNTPTPGTIGLGATAIASGASHTCAIVANGRVSCWGKNDHAQLGNSSTSRRTTPTMVGDNTGHVLDQVATLALGSEHSCASRIDGKAFCWGRNNSAQLAQPSATGDRSLPEPSTNLDGSTALASGAFFGCAMTPTSGATCWGANNVGQLGRNVIDNNANDTPQATSPAVSPITVIAAGAGNGGAHACAVQGGSLMCWGYNKYGQLGDGTTNDRAMPVAVHW